MGGRGWLDPFALAVACRRLVAFGVGICLSCTPVSLVLESRTWNIYNVSPLC